MATYNDLFNTDKDLGDFEKKEDTELKEQILKSIKEVIDNEKEQNKNSDRRSP